MNSVATASKWMQQGIVESHNVRKTFAQTKMHAMNAGVFFLKAKAEIKAGDFNDFVATFNQNISRPTVYRYMQFVETALEWTSTAHPSLKDDPKELLKAAYKVVLLSPKPFVALMRELGEMRKFGEYDAVKYATRKLGTGGEQIEFTFETVFSAVDTLTHLGDENYQITYPEGKDAAEALNELETKLDTALSRVRQIRAHGRVVDV